MAGLPTRGDMLGLLLCGRRMLALLKTPPEPVACADLALAALAINSEIIPLLVISQALDLALHTTHYVVESCT